MPSQGSVPKARVGAGLAYLNNSLYVWGLSDGNDYAENTALYRYSLDNATWTVVPTTGQSDIGLKMRNYLAAAIYNDYFYVVLGAFLRAGEEVDVISRVSLLTGQWENVDFGARLKKNMFASVALAAVWQHAQQHD
jgi:hypothetical protein